MRVLSLVPALYAAIVAPVSAFKAESRNLLPSVDTCANVDVRVIFIILYIQRGLRSLRLTCSCYWACPTFLDKASFKSVFALPLFAVSFNSSDFDRLIVYGSLCSSHCRHHPPRRPGDRGRCRECPRQPCQSLLRFPLSTQRPHRSQARERSVTIQPMHTRYVNRTHPATLV